MYIVKFTDNDMKKEVKTWKAWVLDTLEAYRNYHSNESREQLVLCLARNEYEESLVHPDDRTEEDKERLRAFRVLRRILKY